MHSILNSTLRSRQSNLVVDGKKGAVASIVGSGPGSAAAAPSSSTVSKAEKNNYNNSKVIHPIPVVERVPIEKPPFTLADIRKAIPDHCFERSLLKSSAYLFANIAAIAFLYCLTPYFDHPSLPSIVSWSLWITYWAFQGFFMTGLWVISHECGHGAFSDYSLLNDVVGLCGHSYLLVPYFSWKISHGKHHKRTGNLDYDEAFVPEVGPDTDMFEPSLLMTLANFFFTGTIGWFVYLITHKTGRVYHKHTDHFNPYSPLFSPKERKLIVISDIALLVVCFVLGYLAYQNSFVWLLKVHLIPYFHTNFWLVMITQLHHTDLMLPHFFDKDWNWLQGAMCTVDRDYGFLNVLFHHIGDTHVAHHLFSYMPHYHAVEATKAIAPLLGKYYCKSDTPLLKAMWESTHYCRYVYPEGKALWFNY